MVVADPWDGPTPTSVAVEAGRRLLDLGCDELSLGDTIGIGTPREIVALIAAFRAAGIATERIALHLHDTYGQALANAFAAMAEGVTTFDASAGGIGGSPFAKMAGGNLATEDILWMCKGLGARLPRRSGLAEDARLLGTSRRARDRRRSPTSP